jgi:hypothetical protein
VSDEVIEVEVIDVALSWKYQLGKLLFATIVGFAATQAAQKTFDVGVQAWHNRTNNSEG